ncbi:hypothetical protein GE21DRAFT_1044273 [Neurospora crassa]|nr:hypothetical protein GE21DRAFT_1044273 [Neurospora crassa]
MPRTKLVLQVPLGTYLRLVAGGDLTDSFLVLLLILALLSALSIFSFLSFCLVSYISTGRFCRTTQFIHQLACLGNLYFTVPSTRLAI